MVVLVRIGRNPWLVCPTVTVARPAGTVPLLEGTAEIPSTHLLPSVPRLTPVIPCGFGGGGARRRNLPGGVVWPGGCRCVMPSSEVYFAAGFERQLAGSSNAEFAILCLVLVGRPPVRRWLVSLEPGRKGKGFPFPAAAPWRREEHQGHIPRISACSGCLLFSSSSLLLRLWHAVACSLFSSCLDIDGLCLYDQ